MIRATQMSPFLEQPLAPAPALWPCLTSGPTFVTLRPWKRTLSASDSGPTPRRAKSDFRSVEDNVGTFRHAPRRCSRSTGQLGHGEKFRIANTRPCRQSQLKEPVIRQTSVQSWVSGHTQSVFPAVFDLVDLARE